MKKHTYTHTHSISHTLIYTYTHKNTHTYTQKHTDTRTHSHPQTYIYIFFFNIGIQNSLITKKKKITLKLSQPQFSQIIALLHYSLHTSKKISFYCENSLRRYQLIKYSSKPSCFLFYSVCKNITSLSKMFFLIYSVSRALGNFTQT